MPFFPKPARPRDVEDLTAYRDLYTALNSIQFGTPPSVIDAADHRAPQDLAQILHALDFDPTKLPQRVQEIFSREVDPQSVAAATLAEIREALPDNCPTALEATTDDTLEITRRAAYHIWLNAQCAAGTPPSVIDFDLLPLHILIFDAIRVLGLRRDMIPQSIIDRLTPALDQKTQVLRSDTESVTLEDLNTLFREEPDLPTIRFQTQKTAQEANDDAAYVFIDILGWNRGF